ncbi:MAG: nucleotide sugar dehydrogenase [Planctomycetes bacterium]|nr:nucleotide sugar dehydrogenase [Planctomycetota bacterium]
MTDLLKRIESKQARIGIIGMGYVGLPLSLAFSKAGFTVTGFDIDPAKIDSLNKGKSYIKHIPTEIISESVSNKTFSATADFRGLRKMDAVIICVPTPLTPNREPDMQYIENSARHVRDNLRKGQLIILESTTYPGTTDEVMVPILEETGLKAGRDFYAGFSPEREDPGNKNFSTSTIPKIVSGITPESRMLAERLYAHIVKKVVPVSSCRAAESAKLLENIYRSVNIAMVNELKVLFDRMGIDIWEVIDAAATKPFGFQPFYPGPGLGGHCIPIDPFYLTWKARQYDTPTKFIELAGEINTSMPYYVVDRTMEALNEQGKPITGAKILILGISYKKDVDDKRESPALKLIELFQHKKAKVDYSDPYTPSIPEMRKYKFNMQSKPITAAGLKKYDCVVIATDHTSFDYEFIVKHSKLVIDTRNATKNIKNRAGIVKC